MISIRIAQCADIPALLDIYNYEVEFGVATALMEAVLQLAREAETIHTVVSVITGGNEASIKLHERFGFTFCGRMREVGMKFGRYLDIENYQLILR